MFKRLRIGLNSSGDMRHEVAIERRAESPCNEAGRETLMTDGEISVAAAESSADDNARHISNAARRAKALFI
jgi:hypothetical protein